LGLCTSDQSVSYILVNFIYKDLIILSHVDIVWLTEHTLLW